MTEPIFAKPVPASAQIANNGNRWTEANEANPYLLWDVRTRYTYDSGLAQMAASDPGSPSEFVRLNGPVSQRIVTFHAIRQGAQCEVPEPTPLDPDNEVLLDAIVEPLTPVLSHDGATWVFEIQGTYTFGLKRPMPPKANYHVPPPPYAKVSQNELSYPATAMRPELR